MEFFKPIIKTQLQELCEEWLRQLNQPLPPEPDFTVEEELQQASKLALDVLNSDRQTHHRPNWKKQKSSDRKKGNARKHRPS